MFALHLVHGIYPKMFDKQVYIYNSFFFKTFCYFLFRTTYCVSKTFLLTMYRFHYFLQEWDYFTGMIVSTVIQNKVPLFIFSIRKYINLGYLNEENVTKRVYNIGMLHSVLGFDIWIEFIITSMG